MIPNQLVRWQPAEGLAHRYDFLSLFEKFGYHELRIKLADAKIPARRTILTICWAMAFRKTASFYGLSMFTEDLKLCENWAFFRIENSDYIHKLSRESAGMYSAEDFTHLVIVTTDSIIDIAALQFCDEYLSVEILPIEAVV